MEEKGRAITRWRRRYRGGRGREIQGHEEGGGEEEKEIRRRRRRRR